jgi:glycosyltransferase involved in cell wall biosynthesis
MGARIHIVIAGHLGMSPRGQREAIALRAAGHAVSVTGVSFDHDRALIDQQLMRRNRIRFAPALEMTGRDTSSRVRRLLARANGRLARGRFRRFGTFSPALLGYGGEQLLDACLKKDADLTIVHSEVGLWIAHWLMREGRRVGVDFEDWFSQDLPPESRRERPVLDLAPLENELLHGARYRVASSRAMADALSRHYAVAPPAVVTNALSGEDEEPAREASEFRGHGQPLALHWFSQTIGPARGLELLFEALPLVRHPVRIALRGECGPESRSWLERTIPGSHRGAVEVFPPVAPWELPARVAEHHVGLALETNAIRSRDLCLSNKFFHYLHAGLAVIATDTQGQREGLAPCPEAGTILRENSAVALAEAIDGYAGCPRRWQSAREAARDAARTVWNGANEQAAIVAEAERALSD